LICSSFKLCVIEFAPLGASTDPDTGSSVFVMYFGQDTWNTNGDISTGFVLVKVKRHQSATGAGGLPGTTGAGAGRTNSTDAQTPFWL
jgi:hypothetical protein